jgi:hypothetical protein
MAFQDHLLGGIRWALGLREGDVTPQIKTPLPASATPAPAGRGGAPGAAPGAAPAGGGRGGAPAPAAAPTAPAAR